MTSKVELHVLIDGLDDKRTEEALACLHRVANGENRSATGSTDPDGRDDWDGPAVVSGADFFDAPEKTWQQLAAEQGVRPIERMEDLVVDWWPEDESVDEFVATIRRWRREGPGA